MTDFDFVFTFFCGVATYPFEKSLDVRDIRWHQLRFPTGTNVLAEALEACESVRPDRYEDEQ